MEDGADLGGADKIWSVSDAGHTVTDDCNILTFHQWRHHTLLALKYNVVS